MRRPDAHVDAFGSIPPPLASIFARQVSDLCDRHDVAEPRPPDDLEEAIRKADRLAWPSDYSGLLTGLIFAGIAGGVGAFMWWGWLGLVGEVLVTFIGLMIVYCVLDSKAYAKVIRPTLARYGIESGVSPAQIVFAIRDASKLEHLDSMVTNIERDIALEFVYAATRLGDLVPALQQSIDSSE